MTAYLSCPQWDGNPPDPKSPDEQIRDHQIYLDNYATGRPMWERDMQPIAQAANWRPEHCTFYRLNDDGEIVNDREGNPITERTTNDWNVVAQRPIITRRHRCTVHGVAPEVWARQNAFQRRHNPQLNEKWESRRYEMTAGTRRYTRFIWYRRRAEPNTLHSLWPTYRRPRNATRT